MIPPDDPPPDADEPFLAELAAAMQADEDDEAVYGWMVEQHANASTGNQLAGRAVILTGTA